jgi:hypothetical protein
MTHDAISEARATIARVDRMRPRQLSIEEILAQPVETMNEKHRREIAEDEARRAAKRREYADTDAEVMVRLEQRLDAKFGALIAEQREFVFEVIRESFEIFCDEHIDKKFAELEASIAAIEKHDEPKVIDLPMLPRRAVRHG